MSIEDKPKLVKELAKDAQYTKRCWFCGCSQREAKNLIMGNMSDAAICEVCVDHAYELLHPAP